jgi:hypothetical protein
MCQYFFPFQYIKAKLNVVSYVKIEVMVMVIIHYFVLKFQFLWIIFMGIFFFKWREFLLVLWSVVNLNSGLVWPWSPRKWIIPHNYKWIYSKWLELKPMQNHCSSIQKIDSMKVWDMALLHKTLTNISLPFTPWISNVWTVKI